MLLVKIKTYRRLTELSQNTIFQFSAKLDEKINIELELLAG